MFTRLFINSIQLSLSLILTVSANIAFGQIKPLLFERITIDHGLSQNSVEGITQDKNGFIWIATQDGLNRYDGYSFKIFKSKSGNINSFVTSMITDFALTKDRQYLWLGTIQGVDIMNVNNFDIHHLNNYQERNHLLKENTISSIFIDSKNRIWIGTIDGLNLFDPSTNSLSAYTHNEAETSSISNNNISAIYEDHEGHIWIGTALGLDKISLGENGIEKIEKFPNALLTNNAITIIFQDSERKIWVGTENGLNIIDLRNDTVVQLYNSDKGDDSISDDRITSIIEDSQNKIGRAHV